MSPSGQKPAVQRDFRSRICLHRITRVRMRSGHMGGYSDWVAVEHHPPMLLGPS